MYNFLWDGKVMPNLPEDRHEQDAERRRRGTRGWFPAQPAYREARNARGAQPALSWAELNRLPAGCSTRRGLTAR
jgi:hypothetical protein